MAAPNRPPRTRASGGRTLVLLGVLLALAAGVMVIFVVSQATGPGAQTEQVVVAKADLPAGMILTVGATDASHLAITDAFVVKSVNVDLVPANAQLFVSQENLNVTLNNQVIVGAIYVGDFLRKPDPRLVALGTGASGSLTLINPAQLKPGQVIVRATVPGTTALNPGDTVDIMVILCNLPATAGSSSTSNGCESQTTLQNVYVYAVRGDGIYLVLSHQDALALLFLEQQSSSQQIVIRKPGDADPAKTTPVNEQYIVKNFNF